MSSTATASLKPAQARLLQQLADLPPGLALTPVGQRKAAYLKGWQQAPQNTAQLSAEIVGGRAIAVGLICGPLSGGVLIVDHDGASAGPVLERLLGGDPLPPTWRWSSGRVGRWAAAFRVPETYWPAMRGKWEERTAVKAPDDPAGKREGLEIRWSGHYSVLIGAHPDTDGYRWLPNSSPAEAEIAEAPLPLIEALLKDQQEEPLPLQLGHVVARVDGGNRSVITRRLLVPPAPSPAGLVLPLLEFTSRATREFVETGGTPGQWNDDQLTHALDLLGTEAWLQQQGHRSEPTARDAFAQHIAAARQQDGTFDDRRAWQRFEGGLKHNPTPSATEQQLRDRLAFHTREPQRKRQPRQASAAATQADGVTVTAAGGRRVRLAPDDVLSLLPQRVGRLRLNVRTGDVHSPAGVLSGNQIGRLYLELSSVAETWPKDATTDAVMLLAHRDQFDPVKDWLEGLTVDPLPMEQWERLDHHLLGIDDPIARKALPRYLIGAIARTMEPGCYVRQTPVLIGPQERGKTELGRILFGPDQWVEGVGALDRDALQRAGTAWGVELAELDGVTRRRDQEQLKAFLTETCDSYRIAYDRAPERHPRRFVFWATANRPPLRDSTGSTRFVCIPIPDRMLPLDWAREHRGALWARALEQYRAGVTWLRTDEQERREVEERNSEFIEVDPWAEEIARHLQKDLAADRVPVTVPSLLDRLNVPKERQNAAMALRARQIAEQLGWQHGRRRWGGRDKAAGLFPPSSPGTPPGHPGHPSGHPPGTPADLNQGRGSGPVGHPGHPISSKGSTKEEGQQGRPAAATAPVEQQHASRRVVGVLGCPGCPPDQTVGAASDLPGRVGVPRGVPRGVPTPAQTAPLVDSGNAAGGLSEVSELSVPPTGSAAPPPDRVACLVDGQPGWSRRAGPMRGASVLVTGPDGHSQLVGRDQITAA